MQFDSMNHVTAAARGRRHDLGWSQAETAARAGVSREWINAFEGGKPTVEFGLVLRLVEALGLRLDLVADQHVHEDNDARGGSVDLDAHLDDYRKP